jgi:SPX domain protein involved in polyphosphate accumulation
MKFAEHLSAHVTPEWNSQYIRYDDMKELLAQAIAKAQPFVDESDNILREQFFVRVDEHFFQVRSHFQSFIFNNVYFLVLRKRGNKNQYFFC